MPQREDRADPPRPGGPARREGTEAVNPSRGEPTSVWDPVIRPVTIGATGLIALFAVEYIAVGTAMPTVARALDGLGLYSLAFAATIAASVIGMILGGWWSDHSGPGVVVLAGCAGFAGGLGVAGLAPTMEVFVAGRGLQGLGTGMASVAVYVVIAQGVPDRLRPMVFSLLAAAWVVPGLVGPVLAGLAVELLHWRVVFLGVVPLVVLAVLVLRPALARTSPSQDAPFLRGSTIVWGVVAAVTVAVLNISGGTVGRTELLVGALVAVLLVVAAQRLLPAGTLRLGRGLPSVITARGALGASFIAAEAYLPLLLQELYGFAPAAAGAVLAVGSVTWAGGSYFQGRLKEHVDRYRLMLLGTLVVLGGLLVLLLAVATGWPGWTLLVIWGLTLLGVGLAYPTTSLLTLRLSPPDRVGQNSSALQVAEALASAAILAGAGAVFGVLHGAQPLTAFVAVVGASVLAGLGAVVAATRSRPARAPSADLVA